MLRVAIAVEQNWNTVPGGTARSTNRLIRELLSDPTVELLGVHGRAGARPVLPLPNGLRTVALPVPGRVLTQVWNRSSIPRIERWSGPVDVVHAPGYVVPGAVAPAVVTVHDLAFVRNPEWFTPHGVRFFTRFLDRVRSGDELVIVPSTATATDCVDSGIDEDRIRTIPWGSDPVVVSDDQRDDAMRRHGVNEDTVLFVGTIEPRKNLDGLLAAMRLLPDRELVIVGPDGWGNLDRAGARMLGSIPDADVAALMAASAVLVYPSHHEGFGLPVIESMAQGTPVVVTEGTAPAEIAGSAGLAVDTTDPRVLAEAIESLLGDGSLRRRMGEQGQVRAAGHRWSETAHQTLDVWTEAAR